MKVKQFEDKNLSHFSYAISEASSGEMVLIDPSRDIQPYIQYADQLQVRIVGVIETHPHADFVSGHLELHRHTGATLYCSGLQEAEYPHETFDEGEDIQLGEFTFTAWNTPGHSPDSICIVLSRQGKDIAVFTGDTLFIGDCGRPDLRENTGKVSATREQLAKQMYVSLRDLLRLHDDVIVYPAHGAGTLCGKSLSDAQSSTIGNERLTNWSLQKMEEVEFVRQLISEQPFVPKYFAYDVALNKTGAIDLATALDAIELRDAVKRPITADLLIDTRKADAFKAGHLKGAINIPDGAKFETWLGSVVSPQEPFVLLGGDRLSLLTLLQRIAKIGYEPFVRYAAIVEQGAISMPEIPLVSFKTNPEDYTIVDIRNPSEVREGLIFEHALTIPLNELRERFTEIPVDKPIVVHCAGGYRSAIGSSILEGLLAGKTQVYDLGEAVSAFVKP